MRVGTFTCVGRGCILSLAGADLHVDDSCERPLPLVWVREGFKWHIPHSGLPLFPSRFACEDNVTDCVRKQWQSLTRRPHSHPRGDLIIHHEVCFPDSVTTRGQQSLSAAFPSLRSKAAEPPTMEGHHLDDAPSFATISAEPGKR